MQIWDTVGQEAFRSMNRLYYKACSGCILVYDLSKPQSLDALDDWLNEFLDNFQDSENHTEPSQLSFIVLGNKLDRL
jgi:GTPase SAR1 family protein